MNWDLTDFVVFGVLIAAAGIAYALVARQAASTTYRAAAGTAIATGFVLVWVNGAVGIIGNENNDANMMYFGVLAIGIVGGFMSRFRAPGMARTLLAMAIAQALIAVIASIAGWGTDGSAWPQDLLILSAFFVVLWLLSAGMFHKAARTQSG